MKQMTLSDFVPPTLFFKPVRQPSGFMADNSSIVNPDAILPFKASVATISISVLVVILLWLVSSILFSMTTISPFAKLRTPKPKGRWSWIMGNLIEMQSGNPGDKQLEWTEEYGGAVVYSGLLGTKRLLLSDPKALMYVLQTKCYQFPKPKGARSALSNLLGEGVLTTEGDTHKRQRRIVNPTFSQSAVRGFVPLFYRHAHALATHLRGNMEREGTSSDLAPALVNNLSSEDQSSVPEKGSRIVDVLHWTSRTTLDVIGESAFSYHLDSLAKGNGDKIADSFNTMMTHVGQLTLIQRAQLHFEQFSIFDGLRPLPTTFNKQARACYKAVENVANRILRDRKEGEVMPMQDDTDLLERVLQANEDPNVKANQRLSQEEIMGQLTTLILAGHETTSTALTWALFQLSNNPDIQEKLRKEIMEINEDNCEEDLSYEQLNELQYLDKVTNEVMRLNPPVHSTNREAAGDDLIPLSKPIYQRDGTPIDKLPVPKGQAVIVSVATYNRRKDLWGEDALEFKPDRWDNLPEPILKSGVPGYSLSFLAGPRNCVGQKFALTEFKVILSTLIKTFRFSPPPLDLNVDSKQIIVTRPRIRGMEEAGTQMPLNVTPL